MEPQSLIGHTDPIAPVIFGVTLILVSALLGRYAARHLGQPTVLGELVMGLLLGNLLYYLGFDLMVILREGIACTSISQLVMSGEPVDGLLQNIMGPGASARYLEVVRGPHGADYLAVAQAVGVFSSYGVIFLLFHVGLETCVSEMRQVGGDSFRVATLGVVLPFTLGFLVAWLLEPGHSHTQHMFLGAALGATSIGITARVLHDLNQGQSDEARVIVGAAVIDDVLGLIMLAIVSGIVVTGSIDFASTLYTVIMATVFIGLVLLVGPNLIRLLIWFLKRMDVMEAKLFVSFIFVMILAWAANLVGLATIVGAFAAGLLLLDRHFTAWGDHRQHKYSIKELFAPLESILVPIFFVLMGIQVKLETLLDWNIMFLALGLIAAAVVGKVVAGLGVWPTHKLNRLGIGIGMVPRGEVGLVFASIGKTLGVIEDAMFSAVVAMVIVTTLATPPLLKHVLGEGQSNTKKRKVPKPC